MNGVNDYDNFDGPTSAYVKRNRKTSFAYKFKKMLYERKKAEVEKSISFDDNHATIPSTGSQNPVQPEQRRPSGGVCAMPPG